MKKHGALGIDGISIEVWIVLGESGIYWFTQLLTKILDSKRMLDEWHKSTVVPPYKK